MNRDMYIIGDGKTFLERADLNRLPSLMAVQESPRTSEKYNFFSTANFVDMLMKQEWLPVKAQEQRVRTNDRKGYQKHMVQFRMQENALLNVGDLAIQLTLTNSHDGLSAFHFIAGLWRLACSNGMMVAEALFGIINFRHMGFKEKDVIDASYRVIEDTPKIMGRVKEFKQIELKPADKFLFAQSALDLKFGDGVTDGKEEGADYVIGDRRFNLPAFLAPKRQEDMENNLWTVFNVLQEKLVKGNDYERTVRMNGGRVIHRNKVQGITGIDENIRVNRGLWELVEIFREMGAAA